MSNSTKYTINVTSKGVKKANRNMKKLKNSVGGLGKAVAGLAIGFGVYKLGGAMINIVKSSIETASKFETLRTRLDVLYGSVQRGGEAFDNFNEIAAKTPFQLQDVVDAGATLKAFGIDAEANLQAVADLAAFMQVDMQVAASNMGRAFAAGSGAADMFRDKGINPLIASFAGVKDVTELTLPEFREAMIGAFSDTGTGIAGMTETMSKTWAGQVSNLKDNLDRIKAALGQAFIKKIQPSIEKINKEFGKLGEVGWDNIAEAMLDNWRVIFDQLTRVFADGGLLIGQAMTMGIRAGLQTAYVELIEWGSNTAGEAANDILSNIPIFGFTAKDLGLDVKIFKEDLDRGTNLSWLNKSIDDLMKNFTNRLSQRTTAIEALLKKIREDGKAIADTKWTEDVPSPMFGIPEPKEIEQQYSVLLKPFNEYITILEAQKEAIRKSYNKQTQELIDAGVSEKDALEWKNGQVEKALEEHNNKMAEITENERIKSLEDAIIVQTVKDYELEQFKLSLEKKRKVYEDAGIAEVDFNKWKAEQIKKFKGEEIKAEYDGVAAASDIAGRMAAINESLKGDAKTTAKLQMLQAIIDAYSAANSALKSPAAGGYGNNPVGWAMATLALTQGLANASMINSTMKKMAEGGSFVTNGAEMIMVGDNPSGRERVEVTPLDAVGNPTAGGGGVNVTFTGNVMSEQFIEEQAIPQIKEAIRRGADIGIG